MKKLFFAALLATVAVGGAFAQVNLYNSSRELIAVCQEEQPADCSDIPVAYQSDGTTVIPFALYQDLTYNP